MKAYAIKTKRSFNIKAVWAGRTLLLLAALWLMGMGGGSDDSGSPVPIPARNFTVSVADQGGNTLKAERFTWEGKVYFQAFYGNATVTLPFDKVRSVKLSPKDRSAGATRIKAVVTLASGENVEVAMDRETKLYGETRFGTYEISIKDVDAITFQ